MNSNFTVLDLFSGAGGMSYGFHATPGFRIIGAVDAQHGKPSSGAGSLECNKTYKANIGVTPLQADLTSACFDEIDSYLLRMSSTAEVDVLISCAPCTGFSRTIRRNLVKDDARNSLVARNTHFVEHYRPKIFVMENVGELLEGRFKHHFGVLRDCLESNKYCVSAEVHSLDSFGLPQRRRRSLIIAVRSDYLPHNMNELWDGFCIKADAITVRRAIGSLSPLNAGERDPEDPCHVSPNFSEHGLERLRRIPKNGGSWPDLIKTEDGERFLIPSMRSQIDKGRVGPHPDVYGRMFWDAPSVTLKRECAHTGNGRYAHPAQDRLCSVREMAIIQGFPKNYSFIANSLSNMYRHIGDAVPPLISYQIAAICRWSLTGYKPNLADTILLNTHLHANDLTPINHEMKQLPLTGVG